MENNHQDYRTFQFYDEEGRRLSIFGVVTDMEFVEGDKEVLVPTLVIHVFTCSKRDTFSRKRAIELFRDYQETPETELSHPELFIVPIKDQKPKWTFLMWCKKNFYKRTPYLFGVQVDLLTRGEESLAKPLSVGMEIIPIEEDDVVGEISEN